MPTSRENPLADMRSMPPPNTVSWMVASEVTTMVSTLRTRASWASFSMTLSAEVPAGLNMMRTPPIVSTSPVENWLSPPSNTMTALYSRPAKLMTSLIRRSRAVLNASSV